MRFRQKCGHGGLDLETAAKPFRSLIYQASDIISEESIIFLDMGTALVNDNRGNSFKAWFGRGGVSSGPVSRILSPKFLKKIGTDHESGMSLADHLKRPTRGS